MPTRQQTQKAYADGWQARADNESTDNAPNDPSLNYWWMKGFDDKDKEVKK